MTQIVQLKENIWWIGVLDPKLDVFDIIMETKYGTTYNAYVVKTENGAVLIETVKEKYFDSYLEHIKGVVDVADIKYLISNHTEPDHAGSIGKILEICPDIVVVASKTAVSYLKEIINRDFNYRTAEQLQELVVGKSTFQFISAPFLHWPDSMYSYLKESNVLFTCDSFGSHYSPKKSIKISELGKDEEENYKDALLYYYTAIFSPFKSYVLKGIEKIKDLQLDMICTGHGPVLDARISEIVGTYNQWSTISEKKGNKKIVIPYVSAYGYTEELAMAIEKGIKSVDSSIEVLMYNLNLLNYNNLKSTILGDFSDADGILFGTCTINGDALPFIWDLSLSLSPIVHGGKIVSAFGSYGWSGEGVDNIMDRLNQIRCKVIDGFKIKFRPSKKEQTEAEAFGSNFAKAVISGEIPIKSKKASTGLVDYSALNPSGKSVLWRCVICGEIVSGVTPPEICAACGVGQELFELYTPVEVDFQSKAEEKFVIIGGGVAALSAAEAIRERNSIASILMISKEEILPYYRPSLSDLIFKEIPFEEFYLHQPGWYEEKKITIMLNTEVTKINPSSKSIVLHNGSEIPYDKLIIATGASPNTPPINGVNLQGVFSIRSQTDALSLRQYANGKKTAAVIGGGVLGLEAACALQKLGLDVHIIEAFPRLMPRQLDESASKFLQTTLTNKGIILHLQITSTQILGQDGKVNSVEINGETIPVDLVVINTGIKSNINIAKDAGIECGRGIVVKETMETSIPGIYACGDVAELNKICQGLWSPSLEQGKTAGINAVGDSKVFTTQIEPLSMMAFGTELLSAGTCPPKDPTVSIVSDKDIQTGRFRKLYFKDGKLVYAVLFKGTCKACVVITGIRQKQDYQTVMNCLYK